jgi:hypothetical protein
MAVRSILRPRRGQRGGKLAAFDFAGRPCRDFRHNVDQIRDLERRQPVTDEIPQTVHADFGIPAQHHRGSDVLAKSLVGDAEGARFDHLGMAPQHLLDLRRRHLLSAAIDDVLDATNDEKIPVAIEVSEVAGAKPAVLKCGRGGGGVVVVSAGDRRTAKRDLAAFAGRQAPSLPVHDRNLGAGGATHRAGFAACDRVRRDLRRGLRHPEGVDHRDAEQAFESACQVGRHRRRRRTDDPQRASPHAARAARARGQNRPMDRRHRRIPGRSKLGQPIDKAVGIEARHAGDARPGGQRGQQPGDEAMHMKQRQHAEQPVAWRQRQGRAHVVRRPTYRGVGQRYDLRPRCTA